MNKPIKIGILGGGLISKSIIAEVAGRLDVELVFVLVRNLDRLRDIELPADVGLTDVEAAFERNADLIIEAAVPEVLSRHASRFLERSDVCAFSGSALADRETEQSIRKATSGSGRRFFVPHGAVIALDGIVDARSQIKSITITTTKSGESLGVDPQAHAMLFEGTARDACKLFPRNVNVHAAIALAGVGFDKTTSRIIATPGQKTNEHRIEVTGEGFSWDIRVSSSSLGGVTGSYTPLSAVGSLRRILGGAGVIMV